MKMNTMSRFTLFIAISAIIMIGPTISKADDLIGVKVGYQRFGGIEGPSFLDETDSNGFVGGVEFDKSFTELIYLSLDTQIFLADADAELSTVNLKTKYMLVPITLNLKVRLAFVPLIKPYFGAGVGAYYLRTELEKDNTKSETDKSWGFGYQLIAGAEIQLIDRLRFYFEYQFHQFGTDLEYKTGYNFNADESIQTHQATVGILFKI